MFLLLLMMVVCRNIVSADTVMSVTASARIGESAVLQCHNITDQTLMSVIWKIQLQNNYTCLLSRMASDDSKSNNSCNQRIKGDNLSLTIDSALISDEGNYTCEIVTGHTGTFISVTTLHVSGGETYSLWVLAIIPILLFFTGYVVYWKRSQLRKCFKMSLNTTPPQLQDGTEEVKDEGGGDNQEFEPYAMYTQKENTIYSQASKE
ncbi:uncharacterized protein LOC135050313 isoform X4 [Pseudophryne corroboree]|uniref:uncharacterized protein LOC135050313 isoform X4 n=1 Tax=Pseudophryne corroboree TaxID=495146 RepID=UPI003081E395